MKSKGLIMTVCFIAILAVFTVGSFVAPDREFSQNENRPLEAMPKISAQGVLSGEVQKKLNTYSSDQLVFRDAAISLKTVLQKLSGKRDIGGVYLCKNGAYTERITDDDIDEAIAEKNIEAVRQFLFDNSGAFKTAKVLTAPSPQELCREFLPKYAPCYNAKKYREKLSSALGESLCDQYAAFSAVKDKSSLYYKTDHHWTAAAAELAYKVYCEETDKKAVPTEYTTVATDFRGTLHSKALDPFAPYDSVKAPVVNGAKLVADGKEYDGIYDTAALNEKDKYAYFLHGNHATATVSGGKGTGHLLLIKDSYANCFVPLLLNNYESITLIDPRYFTGSVSALVKSGNYTDFLMLFSMNGFLTETTIPIINA